MGECNEPVPPGGSVRTVRRSLACARISPIGARDGIEQSVGLSLVSPMANAINDALGIRFNELPLSAEKVFLVLKEQKRQSRTSSSKPVRPCQQDLRGFLQTSEVYTCTIAYSS